MTSDVSCSAVLPQQQLLDSSNIGTTVNETLLGGSVDSMTSPTTDTYCSLQEDAAMTSLCRDKAMRLVEDCSSRVMVPVEDCSSRVIVPVEDFSTSEAQETPDSQMQTSIDGNETASRLQLSCDVINQQSTSINPWTRLVIYLINQQSTSANSWTR